MSIKPKQSDWKAVSADYSLEISPLEKGLADEIIGILAAEGYPPPKRLLEAGSGSGHLSLMLRQAGYETDLLDFDDLALQKAREIFRGVLGAEAADRSAFIKGDLLRLEADLAPGQYDLVWNSGVLEHFSRGNLHTALTQMKSATAGAVFVLVPNPSSLVYLAYRQKMLEQQRWNVGVEFLRLDYPEVIEAAGLEVVKTGYCGREFTNTCLRIVLDGSANQGYFESVMTAGQAAAQSLCLRYFLCAPSQGAARRAMPPGEDHSDTLDKTFYLDAMGAANSTISHLRRTLDLREQECQTAQALAAQRDHELRERDQTLHALRARLEDTERALWDVRSHAADREKVVRERDTHRLERERLAREQAILAQERDQAMKQLEVISQSPRFLYAQRLGKLVNCVRHPRQNLPLIKRKTRSLGRKVAKAGYRRLPVALRAPAKQTYNRILAWSRSVAVKPSTEPSPPRVLPIVTNRRVCVVTPAFFDPRGNNMLFGGAERYLIELARLIRGLGYTPEVYQNAEGSWVRYYNDLRVIGLDTGGDVGRLNERFHAEVPEGALTIYLAFGLASPRCHSRSIGISHGIYWDHAGFLSPDALQGGSLKEILQAIHQVSSMVSVDTATINWVRGTRLHLAEKFQYIPNFVDLEEFRPALPAADHDGANRRITVLFARRLCGERGLWMVLDVIPEILERYPAVDFHLVGKGYQHEESAARAMVERYPGRVRLYSLPPERMSEAYRCADISIIPTVHSEGTSLSCLEAQACGNAVIATNVGGLPDLVLNGFNGLLIEPTAPQLREALARLITDSDLRWRLGRQAVEVAQTFGLDRWRGQWTQVLKTHLPDATAATVENPPVALFLNANYIVWERMKQRPHHLASHLAENGIETFWTNTTGRGPSPRPNLHLIDPGDDLYLENPLVVIYYPFDDEVIGRLKRQLKDPILIYDVLDSVEIHPDQNVRENHDRLLDQADMILASSQVLYDHLIERRPDTLLVPNGVDLKHFATGSSVRRPRDLAGPRGPVIGYYGAIAEWFDYDLLYRVAAARPKYQFVLIGPASEPEQLDRLLSLPNIRHLGEKPYEELPGYVAAFDVGILTFRQYEVTRCVRPLKVLEYLAAGKAVVSTRLPDMTGWPGVLMADEAEEFAACLDRALGAKQTFWNGDEVAEFVRGESWEAICRPWISELARIRESRRARDENPVIRQLAPDLPSSLAG